MLLEVGELAEGLLAVGAVVGLDAQVDAQVLRQVGGVGKGLGAMGALVRLGLGVRLGVDLHLRLGEEGKWADFTPEERGRGVRDTAEPQPQRGAHHMDVTLALCGQPTPGVGGENAVLGWQKWRPKLQHLGG